MTPPELPDDADRPDALSRRRFLHDTATLGAFAALGPDLRGLLHRFGGQPSAATEADPDLASLYGGLRWRMLGPFRGGRVAAATGVPGRPHEFWFGAVNGGVWKSIDAGRVWTPVFDGQPVASIGAIAVAPSAPDVVYVGTGESTLRDSAGYGNGVYRSTDAGRTWTHLGLAETHHIGKIAVDPRNPDVVLVAAIGKLYAANPERGIFRSTDGGRTWAKTLGDSDVGAVEVVIDPTDSRVVYAGLWNTRRPPWFTYAPTNGPGGGIFRSTDGGVTWRRLTSGLPASGIGRTGIAVSPTNPRRLYAVVDCLELDPSAPPPPAPKPGERPAPPAQLGGFFRSDDAGETWTRLSSDRALWGRGWYFSKVTVDPTNADVVYVPNVSVSRSMDGGHTWVPLRGSPGGDDYHQAWISAADPDTMIVASDQGAIVTHNARAADPRTVTWSSWLNQPTAQIYHLSVDYRFPYWVTGAQQDSGAIAVRSRGKFAEISIHDWEPIGAGGESGCTVGDPLHPGIIYGGTGSRYDLENNLPVPGTTVPKGPEPDRADWTQPLVLSPADPHALYYASQFLFKSSDGARSWTRISPDLTWAEDHVPPTLDAAAAAQVDRNGRRGVIYTVAPSPLEAPQLWVGTDDGRIWLTPDDGGTWQEVTPKAVRPWSRVTTIEASHFDARSAYASVDRHQLQDYAPYVWRTRDRGRSWQPITNGLPAGVYVHVVKEDPRRRGLLVAGTERGAFVSFDDGDHWRPLQLNLPVTSVRDFQFHDNDLIVATHGRGFWVIDDVGPLRQAAPALLREEVVLFPPSETTLVRQGGDNGTPLQMDEPRAPNPPSGVAIDYWLRADAKGPVTLEILGADGAVLHRFSSEPTPPPARPGIPNTTALWRVPPEPLGTTAGMHRVFWDPESDRDRARVATDDDADDAAMSRSTGTFTARLTVGGRSLTRELVVKPDPRTV